jgi:hypothetical protein
MSPYFFRKKFLSNLPKLRADHTLWLAPYEFLFGLAPREVYPATFVTKSAVRSYRTISPLPLTEVRGGIFSVALSVDSRPPGVTWHVTLWSPDFPLFYK